MLTHDMKPAATISLVVIAVLVTVVIEEIRIKELQSQLKELGSIPEQPSTLTAEDARAVESKPPSIVGRTVEDSSEKAPVATVPEATTPPVITSREIPADFPEPDEEQVKLTALSPYSPLHYELGLNNHERFYLNHLLGIRQQRQQELAGEWIGANAESRAEIERQMTDALTESDTQLQAFLSRPQDYEALVKFLEMDTDRRVISQILPIMDQESIALDMKKEQMLIASHHMARSKAGGIDWQSTKGLQAILAGKATERFEDEWEAIGRSLRDTLPTFLSDDEERVFFTSRKQLKGALLESLQQAAEMLQSGE